MIDSPSTEHHPNPAEETEDPQARPERPAESRRASITILMHDDEEGDDAGDAALQRQRDLSLYEESLKTLGEARSCAARSCPSTRTKSRSTSGASRASSAPGVRQPRRVKPAIRSRSTRRRWRTGRPRRAFKQRADFVRVWDRVKEAYDRASSSRAS
jgi:hypothetical protein